MTRIIAVSNQKGGVAKTTTALTLAAHLAGLGERVLAIDLDPQANLTMGLGVGRDGSTPAGTFEVLVEGLALGEAALPVPSDESGRFFLVPATRRLAKAERELAGEPGFDRILSSQLDVLSGFDAVVLDCPPSLGVLTTNALVASDLCLIPVQCEYFSAMGLASLLEVIEVVRRRCNPRLSWQVLPTLYDRRNGICKGVLAQLQKRFEGRMAGVVIDVDTRLREASARGRPISSFAPRSRANRQYQDLAKELLCHAVA